MDEFFPMTAVEESIISLLERSRAREQKADFPQALRLAQQAFQQASAQGDSEGMAEALTCMGMAEYRLGHYTEVRALASQAISLSAERSRPRADALILLGICAMEQDRLAEMETHLLQAADLCCSLGYDFGRYRALHNLSQVYALRGQFELQMAADEEAYRLACALKLPQRSTPLIAMAFAYLRMGNLARARETLHRLDGEQIESLQNQGYGALLYGMLAQLEGNDSMVLPHYAQARQIAEKIGDPALHILIRLGLSRHYRSQGEIHAALQWAEDAVTWAKCTLNRRMFGRALTERGYAAFLNGDFEAAIADLKFALLELGNRQQTFDQSTAAFLLAAVLFQRGASEAKQAWRSAAEPIVRYGFACILEQERGLAYPLIEAFVEDEESEVAQLSARCLELLQGVPPPPLAITTLGDFVVRQGNRAIPPILFKRRRAGELMRLLLISPRQTLKLEQVIEALCPEKSPPCAIDLVHKATSTLRRALEPGIPNHFPSRYIEVDEGEIRLHLPPGSWVDFVSFEAAVEAQAWQEAIELYKGDLYPQDVYAEWAIIPRERLRCLYLRALLALAQRFLSHHQPRQTIDLCQRILAIDPWQEQAVFLAMKAHMLLNDRSAAIRLYRSLANTLKEELGVQPQSALQTLYEAICQTPDSLTDSDIQTQP